jgi:hypothetical protein
MRAGIKESQVGGSRVRCSLRQNVLVAEVLLPLSVADLPELSRSLSKHVQLARAQRVLLDARRSVRRDPGDADALVFHDAFTEWAVAQTEPLALVLEDELHIAEINMASLGRGASVRAFSSTADAFRHAAKATSRASTAKGDSSPGERRPSLFPRRPSETAILRSSRWSEPPSHE